jgi:hypothetical protein
MSIMSGLIAQQLASRQGLEDSSKFLLLGWTLGSTPVGLGLTLALVNREVDNLPPPPLPATDIIVKPAATPD